MKKLGYPDDKLVYHYDENGAHDLSYWCAVFSEILESMMYRGIESLMS
ncbi:MAG: hypothetical protein K6F88_08265 [Ruminococcus sp.]|nr:hypothetical protein [Ruminococcus sp.]